MKENIKALFLDLGGTFREVYENKPFSDAARKRIAEICKTDMNPDEYYVKGELDEFVKLLNEAVDNIVGIHDKAYRSFPMLLIGGGAQLNGLVSYITPKVLSETVEVVNAKSLGARNPTFFNCLGMLLTQAKYLNLNDEAHPRVGQVTRNPSK